MKLSLTFSLLSVLIIFVNGYYHSSIWKFSSFRGLNFFKATTAPDLLVGLDIAQLRSIAGIYGIINASSMDSQSLREQLRNTFVTLSNSETSGSSQTNTKKSKIVLKRVIRRSNTPSKLNDLDKITGILNTAEESRRNVTLKYSELRSIVNDLLGTKVLFVEARKNVMFEMEALMGTVADEIIPNDIKISFANQSKALAIDEANVETLQICLAVIEAEVRNLEKEIRDIQDYKKMVNTEIGVEDLIESLAKNQFDRDDTFKVIVRQLGTIQEIAEVSSDRPSIDTPENILQTSQDEGSNLQLDEIASVAGRVVVQATGAAASLVRAPVSFLFSDEGKEVRAAGGEALIATGMAGFGFIKAAFAAGKILTKPVVLDDGNQRDSSYWQRLQESVTEVVRDPEVQQAVGESVDSLRSTASNVLKAAGLVALKAAGSGSGPDSGSGSDSASGSGSGRRLLPATSSADKITQKYSGGRDNDVEIGVLMQPREDIVALPVTATASEVLATVVKSCYSRIPIYDTAGGVPDSDGYYDVLDGIVGLVNSKTLLAYVQNVGSTVGSQDTWDSITAGDIMDEVLFMSESLGQKEALQELRRRRVNMAIVVDDDEERTVGLVTVEDLLVEMAEEIYDEVDVAVDEEVNMRE